MEVLNRPAQSGRFNIRTQFPYYEETLYKPDLARRVKGKAVVFDMDMSAGDFLALIYLLKLPVEQIDLKITRFVGILISADGWASAATVDVLYDVLHMMGRDEIPVGLGEVFAMGQTHSAFSAIGDCTFRKSIRHLYGLARGLPRSPRRYVAGNSFGAPPDTPHPELRQPTALDVWKSNVESLNPDRSTTCRKSKSRSKNLKAAADN
ncbi:hypothetical protein L484_002095 [Morus notabilis]|uniref:Uncharacterized protein n=1 Tax=Morus notabilis TaxID=981085 RepID=W9S816_9ROSA|nr:hypothetical protein L484_002095 [Morus notabilis]